MHRVLPRTSLHISRFVEDIAETEAVLPLQTIGDGDAVQLGTSEGNNAQFTKATKKHE